ncbi:hypothetical protein S40293_08974 [Stachybotrys chartarum IBT 40293]|nr:hypothetical protein S40293_08974 [Stachybotrys chartarum IBT 40293]
MDRASLLRPDRREPIQVGFRSICAVCCTDFIPRDKIKLLLDPAKEDDVLHQRYPGSVQRWAPVGKYICMEFRQMHAYGTHVVEAATMHAECYDYVSKHSTSEVLWLATAWRLPWVAAPTMRLESTDAVLPSRQVLKNLNLDIAKISLPEIVIAIKEYCPDSLVWKHAEFDHKLKSITACAAVFPKQSMPLEKVLSWKRGGQPSKVQTPQQTFVRFTMDHDGIREIERMVELPAFGSASSTSCMYSVIDEKDVDFKKHGDWTLIFEAGLARLKLPLLAPLPCIWDTAAPLSSPMLPLIKHQSGLHTTIDLRKARGLSFVVGKHGVCGLHVHTNAEPDAPELWASEESVLVTEYMPLPEGEEILGFELRTPSRVASQGPLGALFKGYLFFRLKLAGTVAVGLQRMHRVNCQALVAPSSPSKLVVVSDPSMHFEADLARMVAIHSYPVGHQEARPYRQYNIYPESHALPENDSPTTYSRASLSEVVRAQVFLHGESRSCAGVLFTYKNGAQRAVGQCRIGLDRSRIYEHPKQMGLTLDMEISLGRPPGMLVMFDGRYCSHDGPLHVTDPDGSRWTQCPMSGELICWAEPDVSFFMPSKLRAPQ